jgi:hypothetical protein
MAQKNTVNQFLLYRVIQEELPLLMELISDDILSKKCHINLDPTINIYRVTFVFDFFFILMLITNYYVLMHLLPQKQINFCGLNCL